MKKGTIKSQTGTMIHDMKIEYLYGFKNVFDQMGQDIRKRATDGIRMRLPH